MVFGFEVFRGVLCFAFFTLLSTPCVTCIGPLGPFGFLTVCLLSSESRQ